MTERAVRLTGHTRSIALSRRYDTSPQDMWDAWTSPDRLRRWLGEVTGELAEGGVVTLNMGEGAVATLTIVRCDPPHRLVVNWSDPSTLDTTAQLQIRGDGDGALVDFEHFGYLDAAATRSFGEGWEDFLDRLGQLLTGAEVRSLSRQEVAAALDPHWIPLVEAPAEDDRWPSVTITDGRATLAGHRRFEVAPHAVWDAITNPARLARWFADVKIDNGAWRAVFNNGTASGTMQSCDAERGFVTTWQWEHESTGSVLRVTLEPDGAGTVVRVEQSDAPAESAKGYGAGWYAMLAGLAMHLDGRVPTEADWDAEFAVAWRAV